MPAIFNVADLVKIGIMSAIFVWGANKLLASVGLDQFQA